MADSVKNYQLFEMGTMAEIAAKGRVEIGDSLALTGCEVTVNSLPAKQGSAFIHTHKKNEEVYLILSGSGTFYVDDEAIPVREGSTVRIDPQGKRAMRAGEEGLMYICIQAGQNTLTQKTMSDGMIADGEKLPWQ